MEDKTKIKLIKRTKETLDGLESRRKAINSRILATEEGQERKKLNSEIKNINIALSDMEYGTDYYDSDQMTIEDYLAKREEGEEETADHLGDPDNDKDMLDPPKKKKK